MHCATTRPIDPSFGLNMATGGHGSRLHRKRTRRRTGGGWARGPPLRASSWLLLLATVTTTLNAVRRVQAFSTTIAPVSRDGLLSWSLTGCGGDDASGRTKRRSALSSSLSASSSRTASSTVAPTKDLSPWPISSENEDDDQSHPTTGTVINTYGMTPAQMERSIVQAGRRGHTDHALRIYRQLPRPSIRQTNAALDACARARPVRLDTAFALFHELFEARQEDDEDDDDDHSPDQAPAPDSIASSSSSASSLAPPPPPSRLQPNVYTFGSLMHACARAGDVDRAQQLLHDMRHRYHVAPNAVVVHAAVTAAARAVRPDVAWALLEQAREANLALSVVGYNAALHAAARAGDIASAVALVQRMERAAQGPNATSTTPLVANEEDGNNNNSHHDDNDDTTLVPAPDAVTYATLLTAFEQVQDWHSLLQYADRMQQAGHALDGLAITSILHACQQLGRADEAVRYFQRWRQGHDVVPSYQRQTAGLQVAGHKRPLRGPDAVAYLLTISACARGGDWQEGLRLLDDYTLQVMTDTDRQGDGDLANHVAVFTAAVRGCELAGQYTAALRVVDQMRQRGVKPNEMTFAAVLGACATACAQATDAAGRQAPLAKALRLLNILRQDPSTVPPNLPIYNAALRVCAEAHALDRAFGLLHEMTIETAHNNSLVPNVVTYGTLMAACERVGDLESVNKVFTLMRQDDIQANEVIYGAAISTCRKAGDAERALLLLRKMIRDNLEPNVVTFNTVISALIEARGRGAKEVERAMLVFQLLTSEKYSSANPNRQTYNLMVRFLAESHRPREAQLLLQKMRKDHGYIPDVHLYTAVVTAYERSGQPLKALRLMESMNADGYDFYEAKVLNAAFKRALKVANVLNKGFSGVSNNDTGEETDLDTLSSSSRRFSSGVDPDSFVKGITLSHKGNPGDDIAKAGQRSSL